MKTPLFKPEDFHRYWSSGQSACSPAQAAEIANAKLQALIDAAPVVYGYQTNEGDFTFCETKIDELDTHKARLICIEELEKKDCKHEPECHWSGLCRCKHCQVELEVEWKEKK